MKLSIFAIFLYSTATIASVSSSKDSSTKHLQNTEARKLCKTNCGYYIAPGGAITYGNTVANSIPLIASLENTQLAVSSPQHGDIGLIALASNGQLRVVTAESLPASSKNWVAAGTGAVLEDSKFVSCLSASGVTFVFAGGSCPEEYKERDVIVDSIPIKNFVAAAGQPSVGSKVN